MFGEGDDHDEKLPTGADPGDSTLASGRLGFQVDDEREYARERDAIEALLFGTTPPKFEIGRYTVLDKIGQGGMGTVYAAYDEQLDRKVAVKILRHEQTGAGSEQRERFVREAQAMAQLAHPNTLTVHEVGEYQDGVFIAMEFVRGVSLDRWLHPESGPRPWREVVEVFAQAGRGLVAAHAAGIVHRDFKPHNAIRRDDGRVQVLDFGLARPLEGGEKGAAGEEGATGEGAATDAKLTATGAVLGTPAYMAPEQWRGESIDARSDQFSFCAALYEGLYGELPFAGETPAQLVENVLDGRIRGRPGGLRVPAWLERVVLRGLALEPAARHRDMAALVDLLERDPARARRRWIGGLGLAALVAGGSVGLTLGLHEPPAQPCTGVEAALAETYNPARVQRAEAALLATQLPYAAGTWERVGPRLEVYADRWVEHSRAACEAHHDGRMSATLFDRATACLAGGRNSLDALLEQLEDADAGVVEGAVGAAAKLPALAPCVDAARLATAEPPLRDPAAADRVAHERARIARARMLFATGKVDAARAELEDVVAVAETLDEPVLLAEAELARGTVAQESWIADEADASLSRALELGLSLGHAALATEAAARRIHVRATMQLRFDQALVDADYAGALLERSGGRGDDRSLAWLYLNNLGTLHDSRGADDEGRARYHEALAAVADAGDTIEAVFTRSNLAQLEVEHHRFDAGIAAQREALAGAQRIYGPEHPMTATLLYILANMLSEAQATGEAVELVARSLAVEEAARGREDPVLAPQLALSAKLANRQRRFAAAEAFARRGLARVGEPNYFALGLRHSLGSALIGQGQREAGLALHGEALTLARELYAEQPSHLAWSLQGVALARLEAGAPEDLLVARERVREALGLREASANTSVIERAAALLVAARVELALGDLDAAEGQLQRVAAVLGEVPAVSPLHPSLAQLQGDLAAARGDWAGAVAAYDDAQVMLETRREPSDPALAELRFALARAQAKTGVSGRSAAQAAIVGLRGAGPPYAEELSQVERWLTAQKNLEKN